jgi:cell division protein FtsB
VKKIPRGRIILWSLIAAGFFLWIYGPAFLKVAGLRGQNRTLEVRIEQLRRENQELKTQKELLENDSLEIERAARRKLGFARSNEVIYKFINQKDLNESSD